MADGRFSIKANEGYSPPQPDLWKGRVLSTLQAQQLQGPWQRSLAALATSQGESRQGRHSAGGTEEFPQPWPGAPTTCSYRASLPRRPAHQPPHRVGLLLGALSQLPHCGHRRPGFRESEASRGPRIWRRRVVTSDACRALEASVWEAARARG